jgi:hypothetical protein
MVTPRDAAPDEEVEQQANEQSALSPLHEASNVKNKIAVMLMQVEQGYPTARPDSAR